MTLTFGEKPEGITLMEKTTFSPVKDTDLVTTDAPIIKDKASDTTRLDRIEAFVNACRVQFNHMGITLPEMMDDPKTNGLSQPVEHH